MSDIRVFKMISGDEVISRVDSEDDKGITLSKPRVLATYPAGEGQVQLSIIPYTVSNPDCTIKIKHEAFAGEIEDPAKELIDGYLTQTTGIALV